MGGIRIIQRIGSKSKVYKRQIQLAGGKRRAVGTNSDDGDMCIDVFVCELIELWMETEGK